MYFCKFDYDDIYMNGFWIFILPSYGLGVYCSYCVKGS